MNPKDVDGNEIKVGDKVRRSSGKVVTVTRCDISAFEHRQVWADDGFWAHPDTLRIVPQEEEHLLEAACQEDPKDAFYVEEGNGEDGGDFLLSLTSADYHVVVSRERLLKIGQEMVKLAEAKKETVRV